MGYSFKYFVAKQCKNFQYLYLVLHSPCNYQKKNPQPTFYTFMDLIGWISYADSSLKVFLSKLHLVEYDIVDVIRYKFQDT